MDRFVFDDNYYKTTFKYGEDVFYVRVELLETKPGWFFENVYMKLPPHLLDGTILLKKNIYRLDEHIVAEYNKWNILLSDGLQSHLENMCDSMLSHMEDTLQAQRRRRKRVKLAYLTNPKPLL